MNTINSHIGDNDVSVVVPTYNELENIALLIDRIDHVFDDLESEYEIIIVDDDSPDGTWQACRQLSATFPIEVIRRVDESGLATAVVAGVQRSTNDIVLVMDGDLQHPPEQIPDLLDPVLSEADIAIGSRFVSGGSVGEFSIPRHAMSIGANFLARMLFPQLWSIRDLQSGFFAFKKSIIQGVTLDPIGYKILIEILIRGDYQSVAEVGYEFDERQGGSSSITIFTVLEYIRHLLRLRIDSFHSA